MYLPGDIATGTSRVFNIDPPRFDPAARQREIDLAIEIATAAIPEAQMRKFGRLSLAPARDDDDHAYFAHIRSEPIGASGAEFRFPMSARETGRRNLPATAAQLVESAVLFANNAGKFGKVVKIVRAIADAALKPATGGIAGMSLIGIGITPNQLDEMVEVTVDVEMLGDDLTMGIERVTGYVTDSRFNWMSRKLHGLAAKHVARRALLAQAKVAGISGWIDDSALRILNRASLDRADAFSMLRAARQMDFSFGGVQGNDIRGGLYWDDGIVRGYVESRARGNVYRLQAKVLTVKVQMLPATVAAGLIGRHLGEVIAFDYIPGNALIIGVQETPDWLYLELEIGLSPIEQVIEA